VWNEAENHIEFINVNLRTGTVSISQAKVSADDAGIVVKYPRIRRTGKGDFTTERMDTVTEDTLVVKFYNTKGEAGETLEDMSLTFAKVK
jgi:hypothetical protein